MVSVTSPRGSKTEMVYQAVHDIGRDLTVSDIGKLTPCCQPGYDTNGA